MRWEVMQNGRWYYYSSNYSRGFYGDQIYCQGKGERKKMYRVSDQRML